MGEQRVTKVSGKRQRQQFVQQLLKDVSSLEYMLDNDWFDNDITRIGAEQEMVIVDKKTFKPSLRAMDVIEVMKDYPWLETELAKFNLEINLEPHELKANCFSKLAEETSYKLNTIQKYASELGIQIILTGILPTLRKDHLHLDNLTPKKRYRALMEAINEQLIGSDYELKLVGIDELRLRHDSPLLEAVNTSFQVHLQVSQHDFVKMYNISQALCGPIMAAAANSPIVFGRRLWHESRIAMFQQALDTRGAQNHLRERSPRVSFGNRWLDSSILEIYREDIARFRVLLSADVEEDSLKLIKRNEVPKLRALQVHNSTIYRWNRPCYGISPNGKPHLRIENRVFSSGPTVTDEIANAAFWLGAMCGMKNEIDDIRDHMSFDDARDNFIKAARFGIDTELNWFGEKKIRAVDLCLKELLPVARKGLQSHGVNQDDIDKYLGVVQERLENHQTGARWMLRSYTHLKAKTSGDEARVVLTSVLAEKQISDKPVHKWELPELGDLADYSPDNLQVSEVMITDVYTVQKDEIPELVARMMDWNNLFYAPVEDTKGRLVGIVDSSVLLRHFVDKKHMGNKRMTTVGDLMIKDPITIDPDTTVKEALTVIRKHNMGCLPVVKDEELIGILTESVFVQLSNTLLERLDQQNR